MKSTQYLYGVEPSRFSDMPYRLAIEFKIECCKELKDDLLIDGYRAADVERLDAVVKAEKFNNQLLKELDDV